MLCHGPDPQLCVHQALRVGAEPMKRKMGQHSTMLTALETDRKQETRFVKKLNVNLIQFSKYLLSSHLVQDCFRD